MNRARELLAHGVAKLDLALDERVLGKLVRYLDLLVQWNASYNLTAIRDPQEMVTKHLLDSLAVWPHIRHEMRGKRLIDVGTGAGIPGIALFILGGIESALLVDSAGKKIRFCRHVIAELELKGIEALSERVEQLPVSLAGDRVISRAFASLADFIKHAGHLCLEGGQLLAMKARPSDQELQDLPAGWTITARQPLCVPGLDAERCLLRVQQCAPVG